MNDELDDRRLRRAVRSALDDIIATGPSASGPPNPRQAPERSGRGPWLHVAAGLTAAAGILGIVAVANRDDDSPAAGEATDAPTSLAAPVLTTDAPAMTTAPSTEAGAPTTTLGVPGIIPPAGRCGDATVPEAVASLQELIGDIDDDGVDDTVTLYAVNDEWRVHASSSASGTASDTALDLALGESIEVATVSFADIDLPAAVMVTAEGPNDRGIDANFTFLTLNPESCVEQWIYRNARGVDEPFEWVALREPGHVTGMICEGRRTPRTYRLVDSEQNDDGTWRVINRILTHDGTRAEISFPPEETVPDSADFVAQYGSIVDCE